MYANTSIGECAGSACSNSCLSQCNVIIGNCAGGTKASISSSSNFHNRVTIVGHGAYACGHRGCCGGEDHVMIGHGAGCNVKGNRIVALGWQALCNSCHCNMCDLVFAGFQAGSSAHCVACNVAIGARAAQNMGIYGGSRCCSTGSIHIGNHASQCKSASICDVFIGFCAGQGFTLANGTKTQKSVAVGVRAGARIGQCAAVLGHVPTPNNIFIGYQAGCNGCSCGKDNIQIGGEHSFCSINGNGVTQYCNVILIGSCQQNVIGSGATRYSNFTRIGACGTGAGCIKVVGCLVKGSGSFNIVHPSPEKCKTHRLHHSFVESPTRGDNLYRWSIETKSCSYSLRLPSYFKYLNENTTVKISPANHFGKAYGEISEDGNILNICSDSDGRYNVLAIGTRCDELALSGWHGVETDMSEYDTKRCSQGCFYGYK